MIGPRLLRRQVRGWVGSDLHAHRRGLTEEHVDRDLIERDVSNAVRWVAGLITSRAAVGARVRRVGFMIIDNLLHSHCGGIAVLVGGDVVRQEIPPGIVRIRQHVTLGVKDDGLRSDGADVMAFAKVVPGDDLLVDELILPDARKISTHLDKLGLQLHSLFPTGGP